MDPVIIVALIAALATVTAAYITAAMRPRRIEQINDPEALIAALIRERDECRSALQRARGV